MGTSGDEKEAKRLAKEHGTFVRDSKHGEIWDINGIRCGLPTKTPSDCRTWTNSLSEIKRAIRASGQGRVDEVEAMNERMGGVMEGLDKSKLGSLGIHVEQTVEVVEHHTDEVTIDLTGLAKLIGLDTGDLKEITVNGPGGTYIEGPLTLKITRVVTKGYPK